MSRNLAFEALLWIAATCLAAVAPVYGDATAAAAPNGAAADGVVTLPLADYLQLVERIDRAEKARAEPSERAVAELTSEATSLTLRNGSAEVRTTYRLELRGEPDSPLLLPATGLARSATVEPAEGAALHRTGEGLVFVASRPGRYTVHLRTVAALEQDSGVARLRLAESKAAVATLDLDLPVEEGWTMSHAVVVEESVAGERRHLRLAPARGKRPVLEVRRRLVGAVEEEARARAVVVTVARPLEGGVERSDMVLYEVQRGELGRFVVTVPAPLELAWAATDEGSVRPFVDGGRLTVERQGRLSGTGHLAVSFRPLAPGASSELPLPPVTPAVDVRSRYLVLASDRAADVVPLPAEAWSRVDLEDLPQTLRPQLAAIGPGAVWRLADAAAEPRLRVALLPAVELLGAVVQRRSTTTLWTVDGSVVHRDVFTLERAGASLDVALPAGATLWSVRVDGQAVRPFERGGTITVPLAFKSEGETRVEVVAVEERAFVRGASRLALEAARVASPVLEHEWRLLLPERHRYRLAASDLQRAPSVRATGGVKIDQLRGSGPTTHSGTVRTGPGTLSGIAGTVVDEEGAALPGVTVAAEGAGGTSRSTFTDVEGRFALFGLESGAYRLSAELDGFATIERRLQVPAGKTAHLEITLQIDHVIEEIVVTSEMQGVTTDTATYRDELERMQMMESARRELAALSQGLAGGVKPLAVEIPESGKLLRLAGALPGERVAVELEMRVKR